MKSTDQTTMFYGAKPETFRKAELLRNNMTPAERTLWEKLNVITSYSIHYTKLYDSSIKHGGLICTFHMNM